MSDTGYRWVMARRPGPALVAEDFELRNFDVPDLTEGDVRVDVQAHTVTPGARAAMVYASFDKPMSIGDPMQGDAIGVVNASQHPSFAPGDLVVGSLGWATHAVVKGAALRVLDSELYGEDIPPETALGALGVSGLTAYVGIFEIARVRAGDTVLVSSAAGAVGSIAGQLAAIAGCDVVGIAGSDRKCRELVELFRYNDAINYRASGDLKAAIAKCRPKGVDVFFDNVGGQTLNAGAASLRPFGRAVMCGRLANYAEGEAQVSAGLGPSDRVTFQGFVVYDYPSVLPIAERRIADWLRAGKLVQRTHKIHGIEQSASAFISLFQPGAEARVIIHVDH